MRKYYSDLVTRYARMYFRNTVIAAAHDFRGVNAVKESLQYFLPKDVEILKQIYQPTIDEYYISNQVLKYSVSNNVPAREIWDLIAKFEQMVAIRCELYDA